MSFTWIIIIVVIIIIICVIENRYYQSSDKQSFKCPNKFEIYTLKLNDSDDKILIYNTEIDKSAVNMGDYKYTYKPKILMTTRIVQPFKQSFKIFKNIDKDTIVTDSVEGFLPYLNYTNELLGAESKYRVLSNISGLKITSNEDYIYIKVPENLDSDSNKNEDKDKNEDEDVN